MRTRHRLATGLIIVLGGTTLAAPALAGSGQDLRSPDAVAAGARPVQLPQAIVPTQDLRSPDVIDAGPAVLPATAGEPVVVNSGASQPSASSGFDWGSAAIGAAGMIGLLGVALGSGLVLHRRRSPVAPPPIAH
jgi:hypothetical protein